MATTHINAEKGQIAKTVVMAGDPLRAKLFAEEYMTDIELVNDVRGMLAYTGFVNGKRATVMGHGMGVSSIGIYAYELYDQYDVENIIRFGSGGSYTKNLNVLDLVINESAWTDGNYGFGFGLKEGELVHASAELVHSLEKIANHIITERKVLRTITHTSPWFYRTANVVKPKDMEDKGITNVSMESYALYAIANALEKKAATILTISDSLVTNEFLDADSRRTAFTDMFKVVQKFIEEHGE